MYIEPQSRTQAFGSEFSQRWKFVAGISFAGDIEMGDYFVLVYASHSVLVFEPGPQRQWEFELATTGQLFLYNY